MKKVIPLLLFLISLHSYSQKKWDYTFQNSDVYGHQFYDFAVIDSNDFSTIVSIKHESSDISKAFLHNYEAIIRFDSTGKKLWEQILPSKQIGDTTPNSIYHYFQAIGLITFKADIIVYGKKWIRGNQKSEVACAYSLKKSDGTINWEFNLPDSNQYSFSAFLDGIKINQNIILLHGLGESNNFSGSDEPFIPLIKSSIITINQNGAFIDSSLVSNLDSVSKYGSAYYLTLDKKENKVVFGGFSLPLPEKLKYTVFDTLFNFLGHNELSYNKHIKRGGNRGYWSIGNKSGLIFENFDDPVNDSIVYFDYSLDTYKIKESILGGDINESTVFYEPGNIICSKVYSKNNALKVSIEKNSMNNFEIQLLNPIQSIINVSLDSSGIIFYTFSETNNSKDSIELVGSLFNSSLNLIETITLSSKYPKYLTAFPLEIEGNKGVVYLTSNFLNSPGKSILGVRFLTPTEAIALHAVPKEISKRKIQVFPNPTPSNSTITFQSAVNTVSLYTSTGALVQQTSEKPINTLPLNLPEGVYFIEYYHNQQRFTQKLIIKN